MWVASKFVRVGLRLRVRAVNRPKRDRVLGRNLPDASMPLEIYCRSRFGYCRK